MARFEGETAFAPDPRDLRLLPLRFERLGADRLLVANMLGDFGFYSEDELRRVSDLRLTPGDGLYERAYSQQLVASTGQHSQL